MRFVPFIVCCIISAIIFDSSICCAEDNGKLHLVCTVTTVNEYNGFQFNIDVNFDNRTVNNYPANINDDAIEWGYNKHGITYTAMIDRITGSYVTNNYHQMHSMGTCDFSTGKYISNQGNGYNFLSLSQAKK